MDTVSKIASTGLCPIDHRLIDEANGWLELGSLAEAWRAVNTVSVDGQGHPAVLELRYHICARLERWGQAIGIAEDLLRLRPDVPISHTLYAYALHRNGQGEEAYDSLRFVCGRFSDNASLLYNMARICCGLGRIEEARSWLGKALDLGDKQLKMDALEDEELVSVWRA